MVRLAWRSLFCLERLVGVRPVRLVASLALRVAAGRPSSYARTSQRVSPRLRGENPDLVKVPERWSRLHPMVRVRRGGLALELDLRDNLQAILFYTGRYEPAFRRHLLAQLCPGDVVADVGAHIGVHALPIARRLARLGAGSVVAFEPAADSAGKLRAAATRNHLEVEVVEAACSDRRAEVPLYADDRYPEEDAGVRSLHGRGRAVAQISAVRFDDWAAARTRGPLDRLDVVKLDVEGHEAAVLEGMRESLTRLRPRAVYVEIKDNAMGRAPINDRRLRARLAGLGYSSTGRTLDHNELFVATAAAE